MNNMKDLQRKEAEIQALKELQEMNELNKQTLLDLVTYGSCYYKITASGKAERLHPMDVIINNNNNNTNDK